MQYNWPGNVRELQNIIERAIVMSEGSTVGLESLPVELRQQDVNFRVHIPEEAVEHPAHPVRVSAPGGTGINQPGAQTDEQQSHTGSEAAGDFAPLPAVQAERVSLRIIVEDRTR